MTAAQPQRVIAGKYELVKPLSEGGMGSVWLAHHLDLDAPVAVKFMHSALAGSRDARARFSREAKAAAQIRSPFVVHIYDYGIEDDTPYIVMEYLEGEDLSTRLRRERLLPVGEAVRICDEICKGLHYAHELGIIHRDLKPGNVFLCAKADDMVKLLDFGIAKEIGARKLVPSPGTTTGQLLGSPHYLSPEQARGMAVDQRSDLWSVAVLLFRALTGKRPFDSTEMGDLVVRICMDPIPKARALRLELPETIEPFFERALSREVDARYPDAKAFAKAFSAAAHGERGLPEAPQSSRDALVATAPSGGLPEMREPGTAAPIDAPVVQGELASRLASASHSTGDDAPVAAELRGGTLDATSSASTTGRERRRRVRVVAAVVALGAAAVASVIGLGQWTEPSTALEPAPTDEAEPTTTVTDSAAASSALEGATAATSTRGPSDVETTPDAAAPSAKASAPARPPSTATARRPTRPGRPTPTSAPLPEIGY